MAKSDLSGQLILFADRPNEVSLANIFCMGKKTEKKEREHSDSVGKI